MAEGDKEAARALKKSKYIPASSRETLRRKDKEAAEGRAISRGGEIFPKAATCRKPGHEERHDKLLQENKLFFALDIIKEKLSLACGMGGEERMRQEISDIIDICEATKNSHFLWFSRLLERRFDGIAT